MDEFTHDPTRPYALSVETGGDAVRTSGPRPELSWKLPAGFASQDAYELEAVIGAVTLSEARRSGQRRFVAWPWRQLASTEKVRWRVRVEHGDTTSDWSDWSTFEAGLFDQDWTAAWISSPSDVVPPLGERPAVVFSTRVVVDGPVADARLYASALGLYEAAVNGVRAGTAELSPGTTSYDETLYAQASDVTAALRPGENTIELVLSDGWFRGSTGAFRLQAAWGATTAVRAELHLTRPDGSTVVAAATGADWQVSESTVVRADLMDGQTTDLTHEPAVIGNAVAGAVTAPPLTWSPAPPVRVTQELPAQTVTRLDADTVVIDFGQNASGRVRLTNLGPAGTRTVLDFGEHLDQAGDLTLTHLDCTAPDGTTVAFVQHDEVVSDGSGAAFEPRHTVHGFRYARISRPGIDLDASDVTMQVIHSDLDRAGSFSCSDDDLTRLWEVADWSFRGNAVDVPTDCPTRERAGWTGDWQIFVPTAVRLFDVDGFSRKWLQSVRDDQLADGRIVNISPDHTRMRTFPNPGLDYATGSSGWGDAVVLVPWELYRSYGDTRVLVDTWDAMVRLVDFELGAAAGGRHPSRIARSAEPAAHEKYVWDATFHFGEWCEPTPLAPDGTPGPTIPDPMAWAMADKGEVATAYLHRSVSTLARIAEIIGRPDEAASYAETAGLILDAWRREFIDDAGRTPNDTQASYVRGLAFGLIPDHLRAAAAGRLVELIREAGGHLGTGFLSTADLLPVLADTGHVDVAHELLFQRTTPSWLGMLDRGATTIWEEWEGIDRNGNAHASLNHYSKGAVVRYLHTHTLGLTQDDASVAWTSFTVAPVVPEGITWARGHLDSPQGRIDVAWETAPEPVLRVDVPAGSRATLVWAGRRVDVGPGHHEIRTDAGPSGQGGTHHETAKA